MINFDLKEDLKPGKYTVIQINEWSAMTIKIEFTLDTYIVKKGYMDKEHLEVYCKVRGKRRLSCITIRNEAIILKEWDLFIGTDTEASEKGLTRCIHGNACFNLCNYAHPENLEEAKKYIEENNLNAGFGDTQKASMLFYIFDDFSRKFGADSQVKFIYPEIETSHAVINQMKDKIQ